MNPFEIAVDHTLEAPMRCPTCNSSDHLLNVQSIEEDRAYPITPDFSTGEVNYGTPAIRWTVYVDNYFTCQACGWKVAAN
jgi:DNA-directed RNA polymerase subunit RPC12/RpoP